MTTGNSAGYSRDGTHTQEPRKKPILFEIPTPISEEEVGEVDETNKTRVDKLMEEDKMLLLRYLFGYENKR